MYPRVENVIQEMKKGVRAGLGRRTRIALIEDHILQRTYTNNLISAEPDMDVVFSGETLPDFVDWLSTAQPQLRPRLVLLDLMVDRQPSANPATVRKLVSSGILVLAFSAMASPPLVRKMLEAGISGIIGKRDSEDDLIRAIRTVLSGEEWMSRELAGVIAHDPSRPKLSDQEERSLVLFASGLPIAEVARSIGVQVGTAKKYLQRVRDKYSEAGRPMRSRLEMYIIANDDGYLAPPDLRQSVPTQQA